MWWPGREHRGHRIEPCRSPQGKDSLLRKKQNIATRKMSKSNSNSFMLQRPWESWGTREMHAHSIPNALLWNQFDVNLIRKRCYPEKSPRNASNFSLQPNFWKAQAEKIACLITYPFCSWIKNSKYNFLTKLNYFNNHRNARTSTSIYYY